MPSSRYSFVFVCLFTYLFADVTSSGKVAISGWYTKEMQSLARCGLRAVCAAKPAFLLKPVQNNVVRNAAALYTSCTYVCISCSSVVIVVISDGQ